MVDNGQEKLLYIAGVLLLNLVLQPNLWAMDSDQYVQLNANEEKRKFSLAERADELYICGRGLFFQQSFDWLSVGFLVSSGESSKHYSSSELRYQNDSYSLFVDYAIDDLWVGSSVQWAEENVDFQTDDMQLVTQRDTDSILVGFDVGYQYIAQVGQLTVGANLSFQDVNEQQKLTYIFNNGIAQVQEVTVQDELITMALMTGYNYLITLKDLPDMSVSLGFSRSISLQGDALVERQITRRGQVIGSDTENPDNDSAQNNQRLRFSIYSGDTDLSLDVERVDDQSISSSYKGISVGMIF